MKKQLPKSGNNEYFEKVYNDCVCKPGWAAFETMINAGIIDESCIMNHFMSYHW